MQDLYFVEMASYCTEQWGTCSLQTDLLWSALRARPCEVNLPCLGVIPAQSQGFPNRGPYHGMDLNSEINRPSPPDFQTPAFLCWLFLLEGVSKQYPFKTSSFLMGRAMHSVVQGRSQLQCDRAHSSPRSTSSDPTTLIFIDSAWVRAEVKAWQVLGARRCFVAWPWCSRYKGICSSQGAPWHLLHAPLSPLLPLQIHSANIYSSEESFGYFISNLT